MHERSQQPKKEISRTKEREMVIPGEEKISSDAGLILDLQQKYGNQAVQRFMSQAGMGEIQRLSQLLPQAVFPG
jgi:hypothetical protein